MFQVDGTTIRMSRGDTGTVTIGVSGYTFESNDRALFSMRNKGGSIIRQEAYEIENNEVTIAFVNSDTDSLSPGDYEWDIRFIIGPKYDENQAIYDGDEVITPNLPMSIQLLPTVGQI